MTLFKIYLRATSKDSQYRVERIPLAWPDLTGSVPEETILVYELYLV